MSLLFITPALSHNLELAIMTGIIDNKHSRKGYIGTVWAMITKAAT